jgi:hypothetical protein
MLVPHLMLTDGMDVCLLARSKNNAARRAFIARRRNMTLLHMDPKIQRRIENLTATIPLAEHPFANDCVLVKRESKVYQLPKQTEWRLLK